MGENQKKINKIEKLNLGVLDHYFAASSLFKIEKKINEIIDFLNKQK